LINSIVKYISGKEIILYDKHRQTKPLASNEINKKKYFFIDVGMIWKNIPFKTSDKRKHRIMYFLLTIINPKFIISVNWISARESLYKVWTKKHTKNKFIVIQHGAYVGGVVIDLDIDHRYTKCDVFLTWGQYFTNEFTKLNSLKKVKIINFGNSIYNTYNRGLSSYKNNNNNKIVVLPSALDEENTIHFSALIKKLQELKFEVILKEHGKQGTEKDDKGVFKYPSLEGVTKLSGDLYTILENNDFDFIISDHSSSLLDAVFFKNKILYFDPNNEWKGYKTNYSNYLINLFNTDLVNATKNTFYELISLENQELLLNDMVYKGTNNIDAITFS
jgi:hypothetical protein